jgi:phage shock protein C
MSYEYGTRHTKIYKSRHGILCGVCAGFAQRFGLSVFWTRLLVFLTFVFTGLWPVGVLYIVAALLMKPEPSYVYVRESGRHSRTRDYAHAHFGNTFEHLDERIRNMEDAVTSKARDWDERLNGG